MVVDKQTFRQVAGAFATGVTVVTCFDEAGQPVGLIEVMKMMNSVPAGVSGTIAELHELLLRWLPALALDEPNARSMHARVVPRTGGIAVLAGVAWLLYRTATKRTSWCRVGPTAAPVASMTPITAGPPWPCSSKRSPRGSTAGSLPVRSIRDGCGLIR